MQTRVVAPLGRIRVLLADDHRVVRIGIRTFLERAGDIEIVGEAADGEEALRMARDLEPDVVVLDMRLPEISGTEVARRLRQDGDRPKILAISAYVHRSLIQEALRAGASGYVTKDEEPKYIIDALRGMVSGKQKMWLSPEVAAEVLDEGAVTQKEQPPLSKPLTDRDRQLLGFLTDGYGNRKIAETLVVTEGSAKNYLSRLFDKLGVRSRMEAVAWVREQERAGISVLRDS